MSGSSDKELLKKAVNFALENFWDDAHKIVQELYSLEAYWIHAVLHKIEGDEFNSRYWYERAQQSFESYPNPLEELNFIKKHL
jgi:hypothetical protein